MDLESHAYMGKDANDILRALKNEMEEMMNEGLIDAIGEWDTEEGPTEVITFKIIHECTLKRSAIWADVVFRFTPESHKLVVYHQLYYGDSPIIFAFPFDLLLDCLRDLRTRFRAWLLMATTEPLDTRMQRFSYASPSNFLAFSMGGHDRLGRHSLVNGLHPDTMKLIHNHFMSN